MDSEAMNSLGGRDSRLLWQHKTPESTRMYEFKRSVEEKHGVQIPDYATLHQWSIQNLNAFWEHVWHFTGTVASVPFSEVGQSSRDSWRH